MTTDTTITPELLDQLLANYEKPEDLTGAVLDEVREWQTRPVCTENLIRVDAVMESPKLAE